MLENEEYVDDSTLKIIAINPLPFLLKLKTNEDTGCQNYFF